MNPNRGLRALAAWLLLGNVSGAPAEDSSPAALLDELRAAVWADLDAAPETQKSQAEALRRSWSEFERKLELGRTREIQDTLIFLNSQGLLSPPTLEKIKTLSTSWSELNEKLRQNYLKEGEAVYNSAITALAAASTPEQAGAVLPLIRSFQLKDLAGYGDDAETQDLRQRVQNLQRFAVAWRSCLDMQTKGHSEQAAKQFSQILSQTRPPLFSKEQLSAMEQRIKPSRSNIHPQNSLGEISNLNQALQVIPAALNEYERSASPENSNPFQIQFLKALATSLELYQSGFLKEAGDAVLAASPPNGNPDYPDLLKVQRCLAFWILQANEPLLKDVTIDPRRNPLEALEAVMVSSAQSLNLKRLHAALAMAQKLERNDSKWQSQVRYVEDLISAISSEEAGLPFQALSHYRRLATQTCRYLDPSIVKDRMQALLKSNPSLGSIPEDSELRAAIYRIFEQDPRFRSMMMTRPPFALPPAQPPIPPAGAENAPAPGQTTANSKPAEPASKAEPTPSSQTQTP